MFRCPLITENLLRDPELSSVTHNCQIYIMPLDTLKIGIYTLKELMNCIKVKRNNLLYSIYSTVSPDSRFKETPFVNCFTDLELSSSLYMFIYIHAFTCLFVYASVRDRKYLSPLACGSLNPPFFHRHAHSFIYLYIRTFTPSPILILLLNDVHFLDDNGYN